ncbi:MAG TPA: DedA family protein [Draconibacterium sp.]|nr:DedA family protein [Draconibacterium sp.]
MHIVLIYIGVFFGMLFEGEMVMISSMIAAHHGYLNFWMVVAIGMVAVYCADSFYFTLGRKKGEKWLNKNPKLKDKAAIIHRKIEKYPILIFIIYRFTFGLRSITPLVIGTSKTKTSTFLLYSALSIILWATFYASVGYVFGAFIKSQLGYIEHIEKYIIGFLIISGIVLILLVRWRKQKKAASIR